MRDRILVCNRGGSRQENFTRFLVSEKNECVYLDEEKKKKKNDRQGYAARIDFR